MRSKVSSIRNVTHLLRQKARFSPKIWLTIFVLVKQEVLDKKIVQGIEENWLLRHTTESQECTLNLHQKSSLKLIYVRQRLFFSDWRWPVVKLKHLGGRRGKVVHFNDLLVSTDSIKRRQYIRPKAVFRISCSRCLAAFFQTHGEKEIKSNTQTNRYRCIFFSLCRCIFS